MEVHFLNSIQDCEPAQWDTLFNSRYPFTQHAFLSALETSGCTTQATGWQPKHILVTHNDTLVAAMPCYLKTHSYGEYVFDWAWANAYQQHGLAYYPKLLTAIPFTPATGPRIAFHKNSKSDHDQREIIRIIDHAIRDKFSANGISSWHVLFPNQQLSNQLHENQWKQRIGIQYHWFNKHYSTFDSFLVTFKSRKRKTVRKERQAVIKQGISMSFVTGHHIDSALIKAFYQFYHSTYLKRSGQHGYLNLSFFEQLIKHLSNNLVMICAKKDTALIAAALCFKDDTTLYGRYWGCEKEYDFLHFETCYYQGIEYCIKNNLQRFDPGAQGEHKIPRGFEPIKTYSNHVILHPEFSHAINQFIDDEKQQTHAYLGHLKSLLPFKLEEP
ncbi:MAG: GNAT family N-acetyltransferase [Piscirickettsiaceae bacterium]|nr:MAG: GNAT family N-acetyltransferase [Piscirickettsiaceae bacterium]PCI70295.1 MAG: GNAT family N-acetyltransferase [Piscirickettsiaceae bacterium]